MGAGPLNPQDQAKANAPPPNGDWKPPRLPQHWQNFFSAILFLLLFPLVPILLEYMLTDEVTAPTATLTAGMYTIGVGISSRGQFFFASSVFIGVVLIALFGNVVGIEHERKVLGAAAATHIANRWAIPGSYACIALIFAWHGLERFSRHIVDRSPLFDFSTK